jgi:hypothetical protein
MQLLDRGYLLALLGHLQPIPDQHQALVQQSGSLTTVRDTSGSEQAVIFLHGFSGGQNDTWGRFPSLVGTEVTDWDIYALGYATTFPPDVVGVVGGRSGYPDPCHAVAYADDD